MGRPDTPELTAAREAGEDLLVTWLVALHGSEERAESWLYRLRMVYTRQADFHPELPGAARISEARRAALTVALAIKEGRR